MTDKKGLWFEDEVQFPRLLAEIFANVKLEDSFLKPVCEAMDLSPADVFSLFERAQDRWDRIKALFPERREHELRRAAKLADELADALELAGEETLWKAADVCTQTIESLIYREFDRTQEEEG